MITTMLALAASLAMPAAISQQLPVDVYADEVRKADSLGIAMSYLDHERQRSMIKLVKTKKGVTLVVGGMRVTQDNVDAYRMENEHKLKVLTEEIARRGSASVAGDYFVRDPAGASETRVPACSPTQDVGPLTLVQDGTTIEFHDTAGKWSGYGVVVEHMFAVVPGSRDQVSPRMLSGVVSDGAMLLLLSDNSVSAANPTGKRAACRLAILSRKQGERRTDVK
ncbi:MAG TPA: hypothetical protein VJ891_00640 [Casimicrobiaceae bacterium]|nr:hypothetical protein [Casimicrobiaceae bacterium]